MVSLFTFNKQMPANTGACEINSTALRVSKSTMEKLAQYSNGASRRSSAQWLAKFSKIEPIGTSIAIQASVKIAASKGRKVTHLTFPELAKWFKMSIYELENMIRLSGVMDVDTDASNVRRVPVTHVVTFLRWVHEFKRPRQEL